MEAAGILHVKLELGATERLWQGAPPQHVASLLQEVETEFKVANYIPLWVA